MKCILLGNAGSGKTTLARQLISNYPDSIGRLSLDSVAFEAGSAQRRPLADSVAEAQAFISRHPHWIIEGCYGDIIQALLPHTDELIFLNPGVEICVAHCRERPWEPEKFASREEQETHLNHLIAWVRSYETRIDEYGLCWHQALYDAFPGRKWQFNNPSQYASVLF